VRLWQGGNQVQAAVIELTNAERRLVARDDGTGTAAQVQTVLAGRRNSAAGGAGMGGTGAGTAGVGEAGRECENSAAVKKGGAQADDATRIVSGGLTYSGATGQADFMGGFRAQTEEGTIRAKDGIAYLREGRGAAVGDAAGGAASDTTAPTATAGPSFSGDLDRVVATGSVELYRPGLKATGTRLVYMASDGSAVLTGDARTPPKAVEAQGTTTGDALRFRTSCGGGGSVEVLGGAGQRVHTDATISDRKNEKGK